VGSFRSLFIFIMAKRFSKQVTNFVGVYLFTASSHLQKFIPGADPMTSEFATLYVPRQRCSRLERFFLGRSICFVFKVHLATRGAVNFYSAGVVSHARRIGSMQTSGNEIDLRTGHSKTCLFV
jgi:hypothetical protein